MLSPQRLECFLFVLSCVLLSSRAQPMPSLDGFGWHILNQYGWQFNTALSDEFNQSPEQFLAPDPSKWARLHPTGWAGSSRSPFDGRLGYTFKGNLVLEQRPGPTPNHDYSAGIASSIAPMGLGYYEVRAKGASQLVSSAWWFFDRLQGGSYELDVFEHFPHGDWGNSRLKSNIHRFSWAPETGNVDHTQDRFSVSGSDSGQPENDGLERLQRPARNPMQFISMPTDSCCEPFGRAQWPRKTGRGIRRCARFSAQASMTGSGVTSAAALQRLQSRFFYVDYFRVWN